MSQIRDKKAHRKRIAIMNPINAKSVQFNELHAFLLFIIIVYYNLLHFLKVNIGYMITVIVIVRS